MSADVNTSGSAVQVGAIRPLFRMTPGGPRYHYDVSPDGKRVLVNTAVDSATVAPISVVVNWPAAISK
jgi:hypothetical protein